MTAARPVGERIRTICAHLDTDGPMGISELRVLIPDVVRSNMGKYCSRAVGLGLLTVERKAGPLGDRHVWTVVPGWRDMVQLRRTTRINPTQQYKQTRWSGVSSVFGMGVI